MTEARLVMNPWMISVRAVIDRAAMVQNTGSTQWLKTSVKTLPGWAACAPAPPAPPDAWPYPVAAKMPAARIMISRTIRNFEDLYRSINFSLLLRFSNLDTTVAATCCGHYAAISRQ